MNKLTTLQFKGEEYELSGDFMDQETPQEIRGNKNFEEISSPQDPYLPSDLVRKEYVDNQTYTHQSNIKENVKKMITYGASNSTFGLVKIWMENGTLYFENKQTELPSSDNLLISISGKHMSLTPSPNDISGTPRTLRDLYNQTYPGINPQNKEIKFVVESNQILGSFSQNRPQIHVGSWDNSTKLILEVKEGAYIVGQGGQGQGSYLLDGSSTISHRGIGENGGTAIKTSRQITIINNGTIQGGGGGGAFFGVGQESFGGGGGQGYFYGRGGQTDVSLPAYRMGEHGTLTSGGQGTKDIYASYPQEFRSGRGGNLGEQGENAIARYNNNTFQQTYGGQQGFYIEGNSYVNWLGNGIRKGNVV